MATRPVRAVVLLEVGGAPAVVRVADVQEVVAVRETTSVPAGPSWLVGLLTSRGAVIPLIDPAVWLGRSARSGSGAGLAVMLGSSLGPIALVVDRVTGVVRERPESAVVLEVEDIVLDCRSAIEVREKGTAS